MIPLVLLLWACASGTDGDQDGFTVLEGDCDDEVDTINPVAPEACNGVDDDCDGEVDDGALGGDWYYVDADGDGFGLSSYTVQHCGPYPGWALERGDCDDGEPSVYPGAPEHCDGRDEDCDALVDDRALDASPWYVDVDMDGWGDDSLVWSACAPEEGWADRSGDCDNRDPDVHPGVPEQCWTPEDDNCDGLTSSQDAEGCTLYYQDADGDGYGGEGACLCGPEGPWLLETSTDCDDGDAEVHPDAEELDDRVDQDCDGQVQLSIGSDSVGLTGEAASDCAGISAAVVGDVTGDGRADLLVGAYGQDTNGSAAGAAYLVKGPVHYPTALSAAQARFSGEAASDQAGFAVAPAGDGDGDGYADLLIGAFGNDTSGSSAGAAYVVRGPVTGLLQLADADGILRGSASPEYLGYAVAGGRDLTGDGVPDLLLGGYDSNAGGTDSGIAWIVPGPVEGEHLVSEVAVSFMGTSSDRFGVSVALSSDQDGDGSPELLIGSPGDDLFLSGTGSLHVYRTPVDTGYALPDASITGETDRSDGLGETVADAGDVNGDGYGDLLAGSPYSDFIRVNAGSVWLVGGPVWGQWTAFDVLTARIVGPASEAALQLGRGAGDLNLDGFDDLVLGARYYDGPMGTDSGGAWVLYGPVSGNVDLAEGADVVFAPKASSDGLGISVGGGEVTDEDPPDLLIGATGDGTRDEGVLYVVPGREP